MTIPCLRCNRTRLTLRNRKVGRLKRLLAVAAIPACLAIVQTARGADETATWFGGNGNWSDASNWSNVPVLIAFPNDGNQGKTFDAVINGGTVTLDQAISIQGLTFNGGTITGGNLLTLSGATAWNGGTMSGTGTTRIVAGATLAFALGGGMTPLLSHSSCILSHFALNSCDFSHAKGRRDGRF